MPPEFKLNNNLLNININIICYQTQTYLYQCLPPPPPPPPVPPDHSLHRVKMIYRYYRQI